MLVSGAPLWFRLKFLNSSIHGPQRLNLEDLVIPRLFFSEKNKSKAVSYPIKYLNVWLAQSSILTFTVDII